MRLGQKFHLRDLAHIISRVAGWGAAIHVALCGFLVLPATANAAVASACSGVSLPRSIVTDIAGQVLVPVITPVENILGVLTLGTVDLGLSTSLANAAAGQPITLNALDINGNAINVLSDPTCQTSADSYTLDTQQGIAFGGNLISGLGTNGRQAFAGELNAIAIGDFASTSAGASGAIAIGENAEATHSGSVALGANSVADGSTLGTAAYLVGGTASAEVNIGARRLSGVAAGASLDDAVNVAQLTVVDDKVTNNTTDITNLSYDLSALDDLAVKYQDGTHANIVLNGSAGTRISNVADGVSATDAVNLGQLDALALDVDALRDDALLYDQVAGAYNARRSGVDQRITGVAAGVNNNDAVNVAQLNAVAQGASNAVQYDDSTKNVATLGGAGGTLVTNVAAGTVSATSTDAVNGAQLHATNQAVADVDQHLQTLATDIAAHLGGGATANSNGSINAPTYQLSSVDGSGMTSTATYNNVGDALDGLSTSISNVNQRIDTVAAVSDRAVTYDGTPGSQKDRITLAGSQGTTITNLRAGDVSAASTDAVNGAQLHATNQQVALNTTDILNLQNGTDGYLQVNNSASRSKPSATGVDSLAAGGDALASGPGSMAAGMGAQALASNSIAIGNGSIADRADSVSVGNASMARQITNVAAGTSATDAVNLGQLQSAMGDTLMAANAYTDARLGQLDFDLARTRRDAAGGTASALAVAGIPQPMDAGTGMLGMGVSTWQGERAIAIGFSKASDNGRVVVRIAGSMNTRRKGGANAGVGFAF